MRTHGGTGWEGVLRGRGGGVDRGAVGNAGQASRQKWMRKCGEGSIEGVRGGEQASMGGGGRHELFCLLILSHHSNQFCHNCYLKL